MKNPAISVIVPIYNSEAYLQECINSILSQTFCDFEIILIDDDSCDKSLEIAEKYAKDHNNIKLVKNIVNQGAAAARNRGMDIAAGKYICFIDSDDFIHEDMFKILYMEAEAYHADIVQCNFASGALKDNIGNSRGKCYTAAKAVIKYLKFKKITGYIGGKLIRNQKLGSLRFQTEFNVGEDGVFLFHVLNLAGSIRYIQSPLYYYRSRENSLSSKSSFSTHIFDNFLQADCIYAICLEQKIPICYAKAFSFVLYYRIYSDLKKYKKHMIYKEQFIQVNRKLKETRKYAFVCGKLTTKVKSILSLLMTSEMENR